MVDTFAPGPGPISDNSKAQRFGQLFGAAQEVVTRKATADLQKQAYTTGVTAIQETLNSQQAVKDVTSGGYVGPNPVAEEAVRGAAYRKAAKQIRDDLYEEWQTTDLNSKHPDAFSDWLRQQLPSRMAEYGISPDDPQAAIYFAPKMETAFKELSNAHLQQYTAYINAETRNEYNTSARETIRDFVVNRGDDGVNTTDLGKVLDRLNNDAQYLGLSGMERDDIMANAIATQAVAYAGDVDTLLEADRILASAEEVRGGEFAKSARVQDVLRRARAEVERSVQSTAREAQRQRADAFGKKSNSYYAMGISLGASGRMTELNDMVTAMTADPDIMSMDPELPGKIVAEANKIHADLGKNLTVGDQPEVVSKYKALIWSTIDANGSPEGLHSVISGLGLNPSDATALHTEVANAVGRKQNEVKDDKSRFTKSLLDDTTRIITKSNELGMFDKDSQIDAQNTAYMLNMDLAEIKDGRKPALVGKDGAEIFYNDLQPSDWMKVAKNRQIVMLEAIAPQLVTTENGVKRIITAAEAQAKAQMAGRGLAEQRTAAQQQAEQRAFEQLIKQDVIEIRAQRARASLATYTAADLFPVKTKWAENSVMEDIQLAFGFTRPARQVSYINKADAAVTQQKLLEDTDIAFSSLPPEVQAERAYLRNGLNQMLNATYMGKMAVADTYNETEGAQAKQLSGIQWLYPQQWPEVNSEVGRLLLSNADKIGGRAQSYRTDISGYFIPNNPELAIRFLSEELFKE